MTTEVLGLFTDSDFECTLLELDVPDIEGWEFFVESHGVTIYRLYNETSGLYQYKVYGELDDVLPSVCAEVYMDLEYRKQWDSFAKVLEVRECEDNHLVYWEVNFPFPLWNRDYLYGRELKVMEKNGQKVWIVLAKSIVSPSVPEASGIVRVDDYLQSAALSSNGKSGTKAFMKYYDNPKGNIPKWLINWAAKVLVCRR
uniref:Phosphatidylcholine transfer protein n=1 Tax=Arion vulgaris TaxID=1028688 RepID=A0A0B6ZGI4_9EUPU